MELDETRLFTIPVAKVWVPDTPALKQQVLPEMLRRYQAGEASKPAQWETDRVHTSFDKGRIIGALPDPYERLLRQFVPTGRYEAELWHNVYWTGQEYQERHHHIPCHLSFIHFLSFDHTQHRPPIFYDPAYLVKAHCRNDALPVEIWEEQAEIEVHEGDALVFPSYLEHRVPPGIYTIPRVTVSMNITLLRNS